MYKIIGGDQREYGPVSAEELRRWIREGRLNARSLVLAENNTEWKPLSAFAEFAEELRVQASQSGEGTATPPPVAPAVWTEEIRAREPQVRVGECLSHSWRLMTANFGLLLGASAVVWAIGLCQFIPFVDLVYQVMAGVFYGGLYLIFLKRIRGQPALAGDVFAGFSLAFGQLVLAGFLSSLLSMIGFCFCILPGLYLGVAWVFSVPLVADKRLEFWSAMELSRQVVTKVWFQILALLVIAFAPTIISGGYARAKVGMTIGPAIQHLLSGGPPDMDRLVQTFLQLNKTGFAVSFSSRLVFLFNLPFAVGALMYAYENLFGPRTKATA